MMFCQILLIYHHNSYKTCSIWFWVVFFFIIWIVYHTLEDNRGINQRFYQQKSLIKPIKDTSRENEKAALSLILDDD